MSCTNINTCTRYSDMFTLLFRGNSPLSLTSGTRVQSYRGADRLLLLLGNAFDPPLGAPSRSLESENRKKSMEAAGAIVPRGGKSSRFSRESRQIIIAIVSRTPKLPSASMFIVGGARRGGEGRGGGRARGIWRDLYLTSLSTSTGCHLVRLMRPSFGARQTSYTASISRARFQASKWPRLRHPITSMILRDH